MEQENPFAGEDSGVGLIGSAHDPEATWAPHGESLLLREGSGLRIYSRKDNTRLTFIRFWILVQSLTEFLQFLTRNCLIFLKFTDH